MHHDSLRPNGIDERIGHSQFLIRQRPSRHGETVACRCRAKLSLIHLFDHHITVEISSTVLKSRLCPHSHSLNDSTRASTNTRPAASAFALTNPQPSPITTAPVKTA